MQPEYTLVFTLSALLILGPVVRGLLERIGVPALVGYIALGCLVIFSLPGIRLHPIQ